MSDRRQFFRINDTISLKYRIVQNDDIEAEIRRSENEQQELSELKNAFNVIEARILSRIERLQKSEPLVADILGLFDKKLTLMQHMLMNNDDNEDIMSNMQQVNLSASGMSFESNTPINEGSHLKIDMVLFPEYHYVSLYAKVVDCRKKIDDSLYRFKVGVEFTGLSDKMQEDIVQHVLSKQASELQQARNLGSQDVVNS
ncbi:MAG: PilZ domain-containing protein [Gammaproteobacteria bacterium]